MASPRGNSFDIGRLIDEDKRQVPVALILSLMMRSTVLGEDFADPLRLAACFNRRMLEQNYTVTRGGVVYVVSDEHRDGWKLRAQYKRKGSTGRYLNGVLFRGEERRGTVNVDLPSDEGAQMDSLLSAMEGQLRE